MLTSCGYHTFTVSKNLTQEEVELLVRDFKRYRDKTGKICIIKCPHYSKDPNGRHYEVVYPEQNKGISWRIRFSNKGFWEDGKYKPCSIKATINPKILIGIIDYLTAATYSDMNIAIVNFESKKISSLLGTFNDYKIKRVDYCINICLNDFIPAYDPALIMNLIKRSDIPQHYEEWMVYDYDSHRKKSRPESFYLCSKSVNINCYSKYLQLLNRTQENVKKGFMPIPPEIINASRSIIRFEVQCKYHKTYSLNKKAEESGNNCVNKYKDILTPLRCVEIISSYYEKVIGKGDWYSLPEAVRIVQSKNFNSQREIRLTSALKYVSQCRSIAKAKASYQGNELLAFKQTLKELADLNINPVTIPREWNIKHIPNFLKAYFNELMEDYSNFNILNENLCAAQGYVEYCEKFKHRPI